MDTAKDYKLWGGCFEQEPSAVLQRLNSSLSVDQRLYREDIRGSMEYARSLLDAQLISEDDHRAITDGLKKVELDIAADLASGGGLRDAEEDIHSVVEKRLARHAGAAALRLHTGRSRNDQAATDLRLWMMAAAVDMETALLQLIQVLVDRADREIDIIMPGYTHLQRAQPIRWSHFLLSHAWSVRDDVLRLREQRPRLARSPLGSGALAGCAFPLDRAALAARLGFRDVTTNSLHAVGSRDHVVEFLNWTALCGVHLSRLAEDLIIYGTQEFGFVRFSDEFSTGSSLMPQKRNPDGLELVRGAAGLLQGEAFGFCAMLKGLPSTYNKDLQADKESVFRSHDRLLSCLKVLTGTVCSLKVNNERMTAALEPGMLATDLAHWLVRRGVPFREAHHHAGAALRRAAALGTDLVHLPPSEYRAICEGFGCGLELRALWAGGWEASVEQYGAVGGTARAAVRDQLLTLRSWLQQLTDH